MSNSISLLGLQWGDEGKGKVVDLLSKDIDAAVRYQGGHNAGHTLIIDGKEVVFHLLPSSICHKNIKCFLGRGVVISLEALFSEIDDAFEFIGDLKDRLVVSNAACLIQPYHKKIDQLRERSRSGTKIGTTGRGIGPAYEDRVGRRSIRVADLYDPNALKVKLEEALDIYNFLIKRHDEDQQEDLNELLDENLKQAERLKPFVGNVIAELKAFQESSIDYSLGICKAYTTRVGEGPFPTELNDEIGSYLAEKGGEVGATTGRPRRCGWLDAVLLSHTVYLNGINGICLTKIDVLDGLEKIKICSDYSSSLSREDILESLALNDIEPQYIELEGWQEPTAGVQRFEDLNDKAIDFIAKVEELCGAPIVMISTGPRREDAIIRKYPL